MRIKATIITLAAMLAVPGTASAIVGQHGDYPAPTGNICHEGLCFDASNAGQVLEKIHVSGDYELVGRMYKSWRFNDIPDEDKATIAPMQEAIYNEIRLNGSLVRTSISVTKPYNQTSAVFCNRFRDFATAGNVGVDRTPDSIMVACSFTRRQSDPAPTTETGATETTENEATPDRIGNVIVPRRSARCGAVRPPSGRVVVRSTKYRCGAARSVVARYARTLKSPSGWSCVASVSDRGMRARCMRKAKGKAAQRGAVYGIWLRR